MSTPSSPLEKLVFGLRGPLLFLFVVTTIFFANQTYDISIDSSLKKMVPLGHPYIQNLYRHKDELSLGNDIRIAVENTRGDIFNREYLEVLRQISEEAFYLPGVNKGVMKSLWTSNVRWSEVDKDGMRGGEIIPQNYDGSDESVREVQSNVLKSDQLGVLVADDMRSSIVYLPLVEYDEDRQDNVNKIDYKLLADQIETGIRQRFETDDIKIHVIGFAKKIGDLIDAAKGVLVFFILTLILTFHVLILDSRCVRSASVVVVGAIMAVIWQLGIVTLLHKAMLNYRDSEQWAGFVERFPTLEPIQFGLDPYSMLIPFLVFAISISHGVQFTNDMALRMAQGKDEFSASLDSFKSLFVPGLLALLSDAIGFITLWFIDIGVIRELAITASVGVAVIILTKLIFVPVVLSYIGISQLGVRRVKYKLDNPSKILLKMSSLTKRKNARLSLILAALLTLTGVYIKQDLKIGDLDAGAPELHANSRYNLDNRFITSNYSVSADVLVIMAETPAMACTEYSALDLIDQFMWHMENVEGVESALSVVSVSKHLVSGLNEGNLKWSALSKIPEILNGTMIYLPSGFTNVNCSLVPIYIFLDDHKSETLGRVVAAVREFSDQHAQESLVKFVLASGNAGIEAATNQTIKRAETRILFMVYSVVSLMVMIAFRSWKAVVCIVLPLMITSVLCEALMTLMGIGVKVATLPVIALGVGIGVDYGIYIFASLKRHLDEGITLQAAYRKTLLITGRSVVFTCITLGISVGFWIFSNIKFQSDMGVLLTFMFFWNMIGAIWLLPALAYFLLKNNQPSTGSTKAIAFGAVILVLGFATPSAWSASNYTLTKQAIADGEFDPPVWYYEDVDSNITLPQAQSLFVQNAYRRVSSDFNAGLGQPVYWFRILVDIAADYDAENNPILYLNIMDPLLDDLQIHHERNGELVDTFKLGDTRPFYDRPFPSSTFVIPFRVNPTEAHAFWVRVSATSSMHLPVRVFTPTQYHKDDALILLAYGALAGLTMVMAFYNFVIGLRVRSSDYFFYVGLLISGATHRVFFSGIGFQYLWPDYPEINQIIRPLVDHCLSITSVLFTQSFLASRIHAPLLHKCLNVWVLGSVVAMVAVFFIPYNYSLYIALWVLMLSFITQYAVGIDSWLNHMKLARLFVLGWFVFLSGGVVHIFASLGTLPLNSFTVHSVEFGLAIQVLALSVALSDRISHIQKEKLDAEQKNVEQMAQYQELYEKSLDGIFEMNASGEITRTNPAFLTLFNLNAGSFDFRSSDNKTHEIYNFWNYCFNANVKAELLGELEKRHQIAGFECELKTEDNQHFWASLSLQSSQKGGQLHYDGVLRDISESKEKEKALLAQRHAEAATTAKSSFLANMSHEIRTPLTAIIGFAEDARSETLSREELNDSVDTIIRSSHHLLDIINEVLDLSKIEAGKLDLEEISVDLIGLINDIQLVFGKRIAAKGLEFILDFELPLPRYMRCDPTRLKQVILNLLGNALKFTDKGSITLKIFHQAEEDQINIQVADTGIGLSQDQLGKIFEAFTQADISTTRNYGGTGLGLSIVTQLLDLMSGKVTVTSEVGKGTTFSVVLPGHCEPGVEMITSQEQVNSVAIARASIAIPQLKAHIIYAEDNAVNQKLVKKLVAKTGATLQVVNNGAEAMNAALKQAPDLLLMDIKMPVVSGKTAVKLLRAHGYTGPIIAFTANVMAGEVDGYLESGFNGYLEKPIDMAKFYLELSKYCGKSSADSLEAKADQPKLVLRGKVLVAEDNAVNQMVIRRYLQSLGLTVVMADNGEAAVGAFEKEEFDLIFMDLEMPILNGYEAFDILKEKQPPPIYALTADNDASTRRHCEALGFAGVLLKPLEKPVIQQMLEARLVAVHN